MNKKHQIGLIGSCIPFDLIQIQTEEESPYNVKKQNKYMGSIIRSLIPPGKIAERLYEEMYHKINWDRPNLIGDESTFIKHQFNFVIKNPNINDFFNNMSSPVILIDLAYETLDYYSYNGEEFDIFPTWYSLKQYFPDWFVTEVGKHRHNTNPAHLNVDFLKEFIKLADFYNKTCIFIDNTFTNVIFDEKLNITYQDLSVFEKNLRIFEKNEVGEVVVVQTKDVFDYFDIFYENAKKVSNYPPHSWVDVDRNVCFMDPYHQYGLHPAHLHLTSRKIIAAALFEKLEDFFKSSTPKSIITV